MGSQLLKDDRLQSLAKCKVSLILSCDDYTVDRSFDRSHSLGATIHERTVELMPKITQMRCFAERMSQIRLTTYHIGAIGEWLR